MERWIQFALVGVLASLIDGALGMGFGATSSSLLVATGAAPLAVSASVHVAKIGTAVVAGVSHHALGNIDWHIVRGVAVPGAIGGFVGAIALANVDGKTAAPWIAGFLFVLGLTIIARFAFGKVRTVTERPSTRRLRIIGLLAGTVDAIGGGGWGPVATPTVMASGIEPRMAIGSVNAAELVMALGATFGFLVTAALGKIDLELVGALVAGGLVSAPAAAMLVRRLNARILGTLVGGMILVTNSRTILNALEAESAVRWTAYIGLALASIVLAARVAREVLANRRRLALVTP